MDTTFPADLATDGTAELARAMRAARTQWVPWVGNVTGAEVAATAGAYRQARLAGKPRTVALAEAADVLTPGWRTFRNLEARVTAYKDAARVLEWIDTFRD